MKKLLSVLCVVLLLAGMLCACKKENEIGLKFYLMPDDTYAVAIGDALCAEEIVIPESYNGKPVTCIGYPDVENFDDDCMEMGGGADLSFSAAPYLKSVTIPSSVTHIGGYAFYGCRNLTSVIFAEGSQLKSLGEGAFIDCISLTSITLPASVERVDEYAFDDCDKLESITFENTVGWTVSYEYKEVYDLPVDVSDPAANAELFKDIYKYHDWKRS